LRHDETKTKFSAAAAQSVYCLNILVDVIPAAKVRRETSTYPGPLLAREVRKGRSRQAGMTEIRPTENFRRDQGVIC
jgi:hypothetical protein